MEIIALTIVITCGVGAMLAALAAMFKAPEPEETLDEQAERASAIDKLVNQIQSERL